MAIRPRGEDDAEQHRNLLSAQDRRTRTRRRVPARSGRDRAGRGELLARALERVDGNRAGEQPLAGPPARPEITNRGGESNVLRAPRADARVRSDSRGVPGGAPSANERPVGVGRDSYRSASPRSLRRHISAAARVPPGESMSRGSPEADREAGQLWDSSRSADSDDSKVEYAGPRASLTLSFSEARRRPRAPRELSRSACRGARRWDRGRRCLRSDLRRG